MRRYAVRGMIGKVSAIDRGPSDIGSGRAKPVVSDHAVEDWYDKYCRIESNPRPSGRTSQESPCHCWR
jgi:hypothetical protein